MPGQTSATAIFSPINELALQRLITILSLAEGHTLLFARCNAPTLRDQLIVAATERLTAQGIAIHTLPLTTPTTDLITQIKDFLSSSSPPGGHSARFFITGLEYSIFFDDPDAPMLAELNLGRELLQQAASLPIVFWLPDYAITALARYALDFWSWRSGLFEFETDEQHHQQSHQQYVQQGQDWLTMSNLTLEQKQRRRRILEGLLVDYEEAIEQEGGSAQAVQATQQERLRLQQQLGQIHVALQEYATALRYYNLALPLSQQVEDKAGEATTLNNMGHVYDALGDKPEALRYYNLALPLSQQVGDKAGEATTLNNMGLVYDALGDKPEALRYYNLALPLSQQVEDKAGEATTLNNMGHVYDALGDKPEALRYYNLALPLSQQVGDKAGEAATLNNMGLVYSALGDKPNALRYYNLALPLQQQVGDIWGESVTRYHVAMVYQDIGQLAEAIVELEQVVAIDAAVAHPDLESNRAMLAQVRAMLTE